MLRRIALLALSVLSFTSVAQSQETRSSQPPNIRTEVRQVLVPVVATDKKGHHVVGLKASDFEVFEDGIQQDIVGLNSSSTAGTIEQLGEQPLVRGANPGNPGRTASSPTPKHTYLICVDALHSAFANFARVRDALRKFFEQKQNGDSQYALVALGREVRVVQDSTEDSAKILAAIQDEPFRNAIRESEASSMANDAQQFTYLLREYCSRCACESKGTTRDDPGCSGIKARVQLFLLSSGERTSMINHNFLRGLNELVKATASMPTTRTIIFISDGFNRFPGQELYAIMAGFGPKDGSFKFNRRDTGDVLQEVLKLAVQYDVKFYTLDSRGLYTAASLGGNGFDASSSGPVPERVDLNATSVARENTDVLAQLAHETGGLFFENSNDFLKGIRQAFADGRTYYVLAYVPKNKTMDGTYRKIMVTVRDRKLRVNAKAGYWATGN